MSDDQPVDDVDAALAAAAGGAGPTASAEEQRFSFGRGDLLVAAIGAVALVLLVVLVVL